MTDALLYKHLYFIYVVLLLYKSLIAYPHGLPLILYP